MKDGRYVSRLMTGPHIVSRYPHTILTQINESSRIVEDKSIENYATFGGGYAPLGVTNQITCYESGTGNNTAVANKFKQQHGIPKTTLYGPMTTYALRQIESGFKTYFSNLRCGDATYPNVYLSFEAQKSKDKTFKLYTLLDVSENHYYMATKEDEILTIADDNGLDPADVIEISVPCLEFGLKHRFVENCFQGDLNADGESSGFNVKEFLVEDAITDTFTKSTIKNLEDGELLSIPVLGLFYRGACTAGNGFRFKITNSPTLTDPHYPEFEGQVIFNNEVMHRFTFCLFDANKNGTNLGFETQASQACTVKFTSNNESATFRPYMISKKTSLLIKDFVAKAQEKIEGSVIAAIKAQYPTFDEVNSSSDLAEYILPEISEWADDTFTKPIPGTSETYLSRFNPLYETGETENVMAVQLSCENDMYFAGGDDGVVGKLVAEGEFDWSATATYTDNKGVEHKDVRVWEELQNKLYKGEIDDALFDARIVRDAIIMGDGYPLSTQAIIDNLVLYREEEFDYDKSRPDFLFIRTPEDTRTSMSSVNDWGRFFKNDNNMSVMNVIGTFKFNDPYSGNIINQSGMFGMFGVNGKLYNYLTSQHSDPFASGTWSTVTSAIPNSVNLAPKKKEDMAYFTEILNINYYVPCSDGLFKLGDVTTYAPGVADPMKNFGAQVNLNRIKNIAYNTMSEHRVIDITSSNLEMLQRIITEKVTPFAAFFKGAISIELRKSVHPKEINENIVVADIVVEGSEYSTRNRVVLTTRRKED